MNVNEYLFPYKWKNVLAIILVVSLSFLDKVIPPFGIPIAIIAIFILFKWKKIPIKYLGIFRPQSWLKTIFIANYKNEKEKEFKTVSFCDDYKTVFVSGGSYR